jgi:hypothetical protein
VCSLLIGWIALMARQNRAIRSELAKLTEQVKTTEAQLAREREIVAILTAPGSRLTPLSGTASAPTAHAMLAYDKKGQALLIAEGLPAAPAGKGYQLWFILANKPVPGQVFNTDATGSGTMRPQVPVDVDQKAIFAITMENSTGASSPTTPILLRSEL